MIRRKLNHICDQVIKMDELYLMHIDGTSPVPYEKAHWEFDENGIPYIWIKEDDNDPPKNQEASRA